MQQSKAATPPPHPLALTETTLTVALTGGGFIKGKVGHASKSCRNNTYCCSDKGVALARGRGGGGEQQPTPGEQRV